MYRIISILLVAIMATIALSAPTPTKTTSKRSFLAKSKGHGKLSGKEALQRAARKYGFQVNIPDVDVKPRDWEPEAVKHPFSHDSDSAASWRSAAWPSQPAHSFNPIAFLSSLGFFAPSASAPPIASASGFGAPSSSSAFASASAPPVRSSAQPSAAPSASASAAPSSASASAPAPSSSSSTGSGTQSGEVAADPAQSGSMYVSPVTIGGNQQFDLDFDTGSSDLWVFSSGASSSAGHTSFNPAKSSSFQTYQGGTWSITYGDGSTASGSVGFDAVTIGGVTAAKQCVELADHASGSFVSDTQSDGLLGLAFSSINTVQPRQQKTFWENVQGQLDMPLFTADLETDNSGTYEFGKIDASKFTGSINYTPVDNSQGFWQVQSGSFSVGGAQQNCDNCSPTIIDTGTSLLIMDDQIVQAYYAQVQGAQNSATYGGFVYSCSVTPPDFGIAVGGYTAVIKGSDMTYAKANKAGTLCYGGIQAGGSSAGLNILGDVLLKQFFAVFDGGKMQFGIAPKA